jgi:hypothetical protein
MVRKMMCAVAVAAALLTAACSSDGSERTVATDHDDSPGGGLLQATTTCRDFAAEAGTGESTATYVSSTTVGAVNALLEGAGREPVAEWASMADDEPIAVCGYSNGNPDADAGTAPTTICPDGSVSSLSTPDQAQFLVDATGHGIPDVTQELLQEQGVAATLDPCAAVPAG